MMTAKTFQRTVRTSLITALVAAGLTLAASAAEAGVIVKTRNGRRVVTVRRAPTTVVVKTPVGRVVVKETKREVVKKVWVPGHWVKKPGRRAVWVKGHWRVV